RESARKIDGRSGEIRVLKRLQLARYRAAGIEKLGAVFGRAACDLRCDVEHGAQQFVVIDFGGEGWKRVKSLAADGSRKDHLSCAQHEDCRAQRWMNCSQCFDAFRKEAGCGFVVRHREATAHLSPRAQFRWL